MWHRGRGSSNLSIKRWARSLECPAHVHDGGFSLATPDFANLSFIDAIFGSRPPFRRRAFADVTPVGALRNHFTLESARSQNTTSRGVNGGDTPGSTKPTMLETMEGIERRALVLPVFRSHVQNGGPPVI